jgi:hypothetical protein
MRGRENGRENEPIDSCVRHFRLQIEVDEAPDDVERLVIIS